MVTTSSRICRSGIGSPASSRTESRVESTSLPSTPLRRRSVDQAVDHLLQAGDGAQEADVARERHPPGERHGGEHAAMEDREGGGDGPVDRRGVAGHRRCRRASGPRSSISRSIISCSRSNGSPGDDLAPPALELARDRAVDRVHHAHQPGDVEGRLEELALGAPGVPLAEEQPVAAERLQELEVGAPDVVAVVGLPDPLDVVGGG